MFTEKTNSYINSLPSADDRLQIVSDLKKAANRLARKHGYGKATKIDIRFDSKDDVLKTRKFGYIKDSTGEYVPKSYVNKCYGKGISYVSAIFDVRIGVKDLFLKI